MRADKLHGIYSQTHRARQQHLVLCIPAETVQAAPRLGLDHHVDCVLAARPILVAYRAGREIVADIRRLSLSEQLKELRHCLVPAERVEVVVAVHRSFVDRQLLQRRVQMVAQRPLQLCQLPACRELPVQRVAVARLITDDSMFLVLRQPIIPRGIPDAPALGIRALAKSGIVLPVQVPTPHTAVIARAVKKRLIPHNRAIRRFHAADLVEDPVRERPCDKLRRIPCVRSVNDVCGVEMVGHLCPAAVAEYLKLWRKEIFCLVPLPCSRNGVLKVVDRCEVAVEHGGKLVAVIGNRMWIIREHRIPDGIRNRAVLCIASIGQIIPIAFPVAWVYNPPCAFAHGKLFFSGIFRLTSALPPRILCLRRFWLEYVRMRLRREGW